MEEETVLALAAAGSGTGPIALSADRDSVSRATPNLVGPFPTKSLLSRT